MCVYYTFMYILYIIHINIYNIFWILTLCQIYSLKNPLPLCGIPVYLIVFFTIQKLFSFMRFYDKSLFFIMF